MRPRVEVGTSLGAVFRGTEREAHRAVRMALNESTGELKNAWRREVTSAGLGQRLARAIRSRMYREESPRFDAGVVWPKAASKIIRSHSEGITIRGKDAYYLAIPTSAVRRYRGSGSRKLTPAQWELLNNRRLHYVPQRNGPALLVDRGGDPIRSQMPRRDGGVRNVRRRKIREIGTVIFILVKQVRLRKRLNLDRQTRIVQRRLPGLIVNRWPR